MSTRKRIVPKTPAMPTGSATRISGQKRLASISSRGRTTRRNRRVAASASASDRAAQVDRRDGDDTRARQQRGDADDRRHEPLGDHHDRQEADALVRLEDREAGGGEELRRDGDPQQQDHGLRLGVDPERERDRSGEGERGEDEQRLQRQRVREVEMDALVVARDLPRQDPVLAEAAEDGDEGRDRETQREDAEARVAELARHDDEEHDRRRLRAEVAERAVRGAGEDPPGACFGRCAVRLSCRLFGLHGH